MALALTSRLQTINTESKNKIHLNKRCPAEPNTVKGEQSCDRSGTVESITAGALHAGEVRYLLVNIYENSIYHWA